MASEVALQLSLAQKSQEQKAVGKANPPTKVTTPRAVSCKAPNSKIMETNNLPAFDLKKLECAASKIMNGCANSYLGLLYLCFTEKGREYHLQLAKTTAIRQFDLKGQDLSSLPSTDTLPEYPHSESNSFADSVLDICLKNGIFEVDSHGNRGSIDHFHPTPPLEILNGIRAVAADEATPIAKRMEFLGASDFPVDGA